jgi:Xaa-Pro aminopeptidase
MAAMPEKFDEHLCTPLSTSELERRWAAARAQMRAAEIDVLVVQGVNNYSGGGYFRWFTDSPASASNPRTAIFPLDGLMTLVEQGPFGVERKFDGTSAPNRGIGKRIFTPSFPSVVYTGAYDAEIVAREIGKVGHKTVGLVAGMAAYYSFGARMTELLRGARVVDATEAIDRVKCVKSAEEIALIRRAAAMQDEVMAKVREHIHPGMKDFEVAAYAQYMGQLLGSEQGIFLGCSAAPGRAVGSRPRSEQGREMRKGDTFKLLVENNGPGGFYAELSRVFVLGKASQEQLDAHALALEAQQNTVKRFKPGTPCSDIQAAHNAFMRSRGLPEDRRVYTHGQGYDLVERPLIRQDETMSISENMNFACHPGYVTERLYSGICDNFLVGPGGSVERLHRAPQEMFEV